MKDYLGLARNLWNLAPRNPTQTYLTRLERVPGGPLKTAFTEAQDRWAAIQKQALKHSYSEYFED